jgi:hypothetical protein
VFYRGAAGSTGEGIIFGPAQATNLAGHRSDEFGQAVKKVKKKKAKGVLR